MFGTGQIKAAAMCLKGWKAGQVYHWVYRCPAAKADVHDLEKVFFVYQLQLLNRRERLIENIVMKQFWHT